jgi:hypothetical protein
MCILRAHKLKSRELEYSSSYGRSHFLPTQTKKLVVNWLCQQHQASVSSHTTQNHNLQFDRYDY